MVKRKIIWFLMLIILWKLITVLTLINPLILPSPDAVVVRLVEGLIHGELFFQLVQSLSLILIGLAVSLVLGIIMCYLDYYYVWFQSLFELLSSMLHPLPSVALLPVMILWFGIGTLPVFVAIIHAIVWSIYLNVKSGFSQVEKTLVEAAHNNGASQWQLFYHVLLPTSKASIFTGVQVGWARGWRALISAEMIFGAISGIGGIGWYMFERRSFMDTTGLYSGILLVILVGILVEQLGIRLFKVTQADTQ